MPWTGAMPVSGRVDCEPSSKVWSHSVMETWLPIKYRDFYDVPRLMVVEYNGQTVF